jgi:predicted ArsR family transcriptional regulator
MRGKRSDLRSLALKTLRRVGPMTADECAETIGATPFSTRPRFSELHKRGRIAATGVQRKNASGRWAHVWEAK